MKTMTEYWDLYDVNGRLIDAKMVRDEEIPEGAYHLSVNIWIVNSKNEILIQKRSPNKKKLPNIWVESAGGAVISGENSFEGAVRETEEELGFKPDVVHLQKIHNFILRNNTLVDVWMLRQDIDVKDMYVDKEEVSEVMWVSFNKLMKLVREGVFAPTILPGLFKVMENIATRTHFGIYALIEREDSILLIKKRRGPYSGMYDLPGGTPEGGETEVETLVREVKEETGSYISDHKFLGDVHVVFDGFKEADGRKGFFFHSGKLYKCEIEGEPLDCISDLDSDGGFWVNKNELNSGNSSALALFALEK
ncbi:MAG: NUDIX domain-containing protein [Lactobacillaceae bacterium]|jgi:8-oxo-dGTP pyrophosphatase MutT (NUDIX family)|nr:NUDIX domain-containing protein [Lactobacillaceae bacterium]